MSHRTIAPAAPIGLAKRRRLSPLVLAAILTAGLLGLEAGPAATQAVATMPMAAAIPRSATIPSEAGPCVAGWREMPIPDGAFVSTPFEVVTRGDQPAWILGGSNKGVLALKWNGTAWKQTAANSTGHRGFNGGFASTANSVLGVGYARPIQEEGGSLEAISGQIVGSAWRGRKVPDPPGSRATLTDVVGVPPGKAWAVGTRLEAGKLRAYAILWNGKAWKRSEPFSGGGAGLMAVDRAPSGSVWAAGWREVGRGRPRPFIARRTKSGWSGSRGAQGLPAGGAVITDIAFPGATQGWAVGYNVASGSSRHDAFLQRWNGKKWSMVELPWTSDFSAIPRSVTAGPGDELWIAGTQLATADREERGFIAHLKGGEWGISVLGVPKDVHSEVMDVGLTKSGAVAAAAVGATILVLRTCQTANAAAAASSDRIEISNMPARREATEREAGRGTDAFADDEVVVDASVAAEGSEARPLAAPVASKGFIVRDVTAAAGLASNTRTYGGFAGDLDGDGWTDIFYSRHGGVLPRLAMGSARGFDYAPTGAAFTTGDRHGCARADVNKDGDADIFCAIGAARGKTLSRHELSLSVATGNRRLARGSAGINDPLGRGRQVAFLRLDDDAYPEVFITNSPDRNDGLPGYNRFYRNRDGRFVSAPGVGLDTSQGGACLSTGDFDQDGDQDLVYCTQFPLSGSPGIRFMRNEKGRLVDRTGSLGIRPMTDIDVDFADVTGDGRKDLIQLSAGRLRVSKWTPAGYRKIYEAKIPDSVALASGDASGDGRADIYIVRGASRKNLPDRLLVNRKGGRAYTSVRIPQTSQGSGDDVIALDYDRNGLTDFLVLNGRRNAPGPIQLLASFAR